MFEVPADAYSRYMGRFSEPLADRLVDHLALSDDSGVTAVDVGCGPGALTTRLSAALGAGSVWAVDPMSAFVAAVDERCPGVHTSVASAESLPFDDDTFDLATASLVVHFMADPVAGLAEMRRVTRPGGRVAATVWDLAGHASPLAAFWGGATDIDPEVTTEAWMPGARAGHLAELFEQAGLDDVVPAVLTIHVPFESFEEWWDPFTFGVGPAGAYVASLDEDGIARLREACAARLGAGPFEVTGNAWTVVARP